MNNWLSGIRGTILTISLWVVGWGVGFGGLIEAFIDPDGKVLDIWPVAMAIPGFIGGVVFAGLMAVTESRVGLDTVSYLRSVLFGAAAGFVIGAIAMARGIELTLTTGKIFIITILLGMTAALGTSVFFRLAARWQNRSVAKMTMP